MCQQPAERMGWLSGGQCWLKSLTPRRLLDCAGCSACMAACCNCCSALSATAPAAAGGHRQGTLPPPLLWLHLPAATDWPRIYATALPLLLPELQPLKQTQRAALHTLHCLPAQRRRTFLGDRPRGPILGARELAAPTSPPVARTYTCSRAGGG